MANISINLPDEHVKKLNELAQRYGITIDELVQSSLDEMLAQPNKLFKQAANYVLNKNSELYRRLAK